MRVAPSQTSLFAAAVIVACALWIAAPAMAAEVIAPGKPAAGTASVTTASLPAKRHRIWPRYRVASWYASHLRDADAAPSGWQSYFSSRPALLMVGIGY